MIKLDKEYLNEILKQSIVSIKAIVKKLGFDENEYSKSMNLPNFIFANSLPFDRTFMYLPQSKSIDNLNIGMKFDSIKQNSNVFERDVKLKELKELLLSTIDNGNIFVSLQNLEFDEDYDVANLVSELLRANNNVMIEDYLYGIDLEKTKINRLTEETKIYFLNYFTDVYKSNIDFSLKDVKNYTKEELKKLERDNINFSLGTVKYYSKQEQKELKKYDEILLKFQSEIYEELLQLIAFITFNISSNPNKSINQSLEEFVILIDDESDSFNLKTKFLAQEILKTNNLDIFRCIFDPITYSLGDIHNRELLSFFSKEQIDYLCIMNANINTNTYKKML